MTFSSTSPKLVLSSPKWKTRGSRRVSSPGVSPDKILSLVAVDLKSSIKHRGKMNISHISFKELRLKSFSIFDDDWFLLSCGDLQNRHFNSMTVSWGSIGIMWNKPFIQVVVRPTRYTHEFMQQYPDFTVCAFPESQHKALALLGAKSGRDGDKIAQAKITPVKSLVVGSPVFEEANLIFECRKMYSDIFRPEQFLDPTIDNVYAKNDYHSIYYGEILAIRGDRSLFT